MKSKKFSFLKWTSMFLTFALLLCFAANANIVSADETDKSGLQYSVSNGEATITKYTGTDTEIKIPSKLDGNTVTSIGWRAFEGCSSLTSITIPDSVTSIDWYAFYNCSNLTNITIPDSVTSIDATAFFGCSNLKSIKVSKNNKNYSSKDGVLFNKDKTEILLCPKGKSGSFKIPNSITSIDGDDFSNCSSLTSITIPNSVTSIGWNAFQYCESLKSIIIPNSVTYIPGMAFLCCKDLESVTLPEGFKTINRKFFEGCTSLTKITLPNTVTSIERDAFNCCKSLESITIPNSVTRIEAGAFANCTNLSEIKLSPNNSYFVVEGGILFNKDKTTLIQYPAGKTGSSYTIPESVTTIESSAFNGSHLKSITIPKSVTSIGSFAFANCTNLHEIKLSSNNSEFVVDNGIIFNKNKTALIQYPAGKSGGYKIPGSVTTIYEGAFEGSDIENVTIPKSVTSIAYASFKNCFSLKSVTIPKSVTKITHSAFSDCRNIKEVYYESDETDWNKIYIGSDNDYLINAKRIYNAKIEKEEDETSKRNFTDSDTKINVELPKDSGLEDTEFVADEVDGGNFNLSDENFTGLCFYEIHFEDKNGKKIQPKKGEKVKVSIPVPDPLPNGVTLENLQVVHIKDGKLEPPMEITIKDGYIIFETDHFSIYAIVVAKTGTPDIQVNTSPVGLKYEIVTDDSGNKTATITGYDSSLSGKITIPETIDGHTVTAIDYGAFFKSDFKSITIPKSVINIGWYAFLDCKSLLEIKVSKNNKYYTSENGVLFDKDKTTLIQYPAGKAGNYTIPKSVTTISEYAFSSSGLESITIPKSVTSIKYAAFSSCKHLREINLSKNNSKYTYENGVLFNKDKTTLIQYLASKTESVYTIPDSVTTIGGYAFSSSNLQSITIPKSVTSIESHAFLNCTKLKNIELPKVLKEISIHLFNGCTSLTKIKLPSKITTIGEYAFYNSGIKTINIPKSVTNIRERAFEGCTDLKTVNFYGTEKQWKKIEIGNYNAPLKEAKIDFKG